jgi:DNA-binding transcriptional LysR family regulator
MTPVGRTLLHHASLVLQQTKCLRGGLSDYVSGFKGSVRLLCNISALSEHLRQIPSGFFADHRAISVDARRAYQ